MPLLRLSAGSALAALLLVTPASAASRPHVTLAYASADIETGQPVVFTYRATGLAHGDRVVFQRPVGTAGVWRTVRTLRARSATISAPTAAQGLRTFRVAVLNKRRHVRTKSTRTLRVYAPVALATIAGAQTDTVAVGGSLFRYIAGHGMAVNGGDECLFFSTCNTGDTLQAMSLDHSSCRTLTLQLAVLSTAADITPVGVSVVSEAADAVSVAVPVNGTASLPATIRGDAQIRYAVQTHVDDNDGLYFNGTADCYTPSGSTQNNNI